jgi:hypothetical protein
MCNGHNKCGNEQYHCKDCGAYRVIRPHEKYSSETKATVLKAYSLVLPVEHHRQWIGRYTRRTLSFSKEDHYHDLITRWFILEHNLRMRSLLTL